MRIPLFLIPRAFVRQRLEKALRDESLKLFHEPLRFLFTKKLSPEDQAAVAPIEAIRTEMIAVPDAVVGIHHSPEEDPQIFTSTLATRLKPDIGRTDSLLRIASRASIHPYWGTFLYLCANAARAKNILELGSCVGISGSYLASAKNCDRFITVEGSGDLAPMARANIRRVNGCAELLNTNFDDAIDRLSKELEGKLDLAYIDGQHTFDATLHYLERVLPLLSEGSLVLFDDIYWSRGMEAAWKKIARTAGFSLAIDFGRVGVCVRRRDAAQPKRYSFALFTEHWGKGHSR